MTAKITRSYVCSYCSRTGFIWSDGTISGHASWCETNTPVAPRVVPAWASRCPCREFWSLCGIHRDQGPEVRDMGPVRE